MNGMRPGATIDTTHHILGVALPAVPEAACHFGAAAIAMACTYRHDWHHVTIAVALLIFLIR